MRFSSLLAALAWLAVPGASQGASQGASEGASRHADFAAGLAAYDGGDYRTALEQWRALAEAGDATNSSPNSVPNSAPKPRRG